MRDVLILIAVVFAGHTSGCLGASVWPSPILVQPEPGDWFVYYESGTNATYRIEVLSEGPGLGSAGEIVDSITVHYERDAEDGPSLAFERLEADSHRRYSTLVECAESDKKCPRGWREVDFALAEGVGFLGTSEMWGKTIEAVSQVYEVQAASRLGVGCVSIHLGDATQANPRFEGFPILYQPTIVRGCPGDRAPREIENRLHTYRLDSSGQAAPSLAPSIPNVEKFAAARDRLEWASWDRRTPPLGPPFEAFPHSEAVRWLEANDSSYREFAARYPDAFVRLSSHFETGGGSGLFRNYLAFEREIIFQTTSGDAYRVVLEKHFTNTAGILSEKILKIDGKMMYLRVHFDAARAASKAVVFESAHRWANLLMGRPPVHTLFAISHGPGYQFNYKGDLGGGGASLLEAVVINGTTGKLVRLDVAGPRWG